MAVKKEDVIAYLEKANMMEVSELISEIEEKFGVSAAAPVMVGGAMPAGGETGGAAEEKTEFTVTLNSFGSEKIKVIKVVREITSLGLKEAKELVEGAPKPISEGVSKEDADSAAEKLKEAGAEVEVT